MHYKNKMKHSTTVLVILILLFAFSSGVSALMLELSLEDLTRGSDTVVKGTVLTTESHWNADRTSIYTEVLISVDLDLSGTLDQDEIIIIVPGGVVGNEALRVSDTPFFTTGEKVFLFLEELSRARASEMQILSDPRQVPHYRVYGSFQGKLEFEDPAEGLETTISVLGLLQDKSDDLGGPFANVGILEAGDRDIVSGPSPSYVLRDRWEEDSPVVNYRIHTSFSAAERNAIITSGETWNVTGWSNFSDARIFTNGRASASGFFTNFGRANEPGPQGWIRNPNFPGSWRIAPNTMFTRGEEGKIYSARYRNYNYANFAYTVRMLRRNSNFRNHIYIRASGDFFGIGHNKSSYVFGYHNRGRYNISKYDENGRAINIQPWTDSNAINRNGWNSLRIRAVGDRLTFYINGTLVNTIRDNSFARGRVGFGMYRSLSDPANTRFNVAWARLRPLTANAVLNIDQVSPEQEALNREARLSNINILFDHDDDQDYRQ